MSKWSHYRKIKKDDKYITGVDLGSAMFNPVDHRYKANMSAYEDIVRRHKKVEQMRNSRASYGSVSSSSSTGNGPELTVDTMAQLAKSMRDMSLYSRPYSFTSSGPVTIDFDPPLVAKEKPKPKPIVKKVEFDSVVLEKEKKQAVIEALDQIGNHELIFEKWGFGKTLEKGKAVSMLFYGPPGTGKTLLAQAIADKLDKKLKVIGSAEIESSEPGAAERNIKAIFEGTKKDTVLLFDECDSLVYDRTNVGSILAAQVNQLLSSLEKFEGVVVFTTNRLGVLDEAFNRRLSLKLEFELPKFAERLKIWKRMFPKEAPLAKGINWDALAEPEIAGGHIKNAVLRAARSAASQKVKKGTQKQITQAILEKALRAEIEEMVKFMQAKENEGTLPHGVGYTLRKG